MNTSIIRIEIRFEQDIVYARQRARMIAKILGFSIQDQTRIATAVSEISRNALQYAKGGSVNFLIEEKDQCSCFTIVVSDHGPGISNLDEILEGRYTSLTGMGLGIIGSRRLLDYFDIKTGPEFGTTVTLRKLLPISMPLTPDKLRQILEALSLPGHESPLEEIRAQNQELLRTLELLRLKEEDVRRLNEELIKTNDGVLALNTDLELKNERIKKSESELLERNHYLKDFASIVSHDLKAPLRGILGYAQELKLKHSIGTSDRAQFCITQIITAGQNLEHLIEGLLQYAQMDTNDPVNSEVHLPNLVSRILQDRKEEIAQHLTVVKVDIPFTTLTTWETGLQEVLSNLIDNAIKFSRKASLPQISIRALELENSWQIIVSDNGIGFDMNYYDRLFKLFSRLVPIQEFEGTGAGLAIVKKILDKMHGNVRAESKLGEGAIFFVELPK
jgi:light-regulated signal transduction histidine kinase (bacteriophytochrome)